jgi:CHAD domain-containing protein
MNKWLSNVSPSDPAVEVAARSLADRLKAVRRYLRRSVKRPNEPENVHQLRVWSRRSEAALSLYADLLPLRLLKRVRRTVRKLRRAAGRVRDCDVFASQVAGPGGKWPSALKKDRVRAQRKLVTLFDRLDAGRKFKRDSARLIRRLRERNDGATESFAVRARESLRPIASAFFGTFPLPVPDSQLHRFRIAGKDLRYAIELLAAAFPLSFRDEVYPTLSQLQDRLGRINDAVVVRDRLREWTEQSDDPAELSELRRRLAATEIELSKNRDGFPRWWTPELRESLHTKFDEVLRT